MPRTVKLMLEYDGTGFCGWQRQNNGMAIQQCLEDALARMIGPVQVFGASRTDAGVHARGQAAHFQTEATIDLDGFRRGLNTYLPAQIAVVDAEDMPDGFHARFDSIGKHYVYRIYTRPSRSPTRRLYGWHYPFNLAIAKMRKAAQRLIGEHDFAAFRAAGCQAKTSVRAIHAATVRQAGANEIRISIHGNAFLRNMVRIIAGTLVEVGHELRPPQAVSDALASGARNDCGRTAPACGLTLNQVFFHKNKYLKSWQTDQQGE